MTNALRSCAMVVIASAGTLYFVNLLGVLCVAYAIVACGSLLFASRLIEQHIPLELAQESAKMLANEKCLLEEQVTALSNIVTDNNERGEELAKKICVAHRQLCAENDRHESLNKNQAKLLAIDLFLHFDANHDNTLDADEVCNIAQFLHSRNPDVMSSVMEKQTMAMEDLVELLISEVSA